MLDDIEIGEVILSAVRRYDASMALVVPESDNSDVNRYLVNPMRSYLAASGKRLRPLLCELGCEIVGGDRSWVEPVGKSIESFHTAALIHDDIEDESDLRRGKPSYHVSEGVPCGINAGDYGLALAFKLLVDCPGYTDDMRLRIIREFVDTALRTIEGQAVDIGWARDGRFDTSVEDCLFVCEHKSAYYTCAAPLAVGAIVGGGTERQVQTLREIGIDMGIAFQLKDDLLNIQASESSTGKTRLNDLAEGKRTALVAHALQHSSRSDELKQLFDRGISTEEDENAALSIIHEAGSVEYVSNLMHSLCEKASRILGEEFGESQARSTISSLIDYVAHRMR